MERIINEKSKLFDIKTSTNYGSFNNTEGDNKNQIELQSFPTKKIKVFSLFPDPNANLQKKIADLNSVQVETVKINAGISR